jgi:hypothetical protein
MEATSAVTKEWYRLERLEATEVPVCGCLVVTTGRPPMTDVGGSAAIYIDPSDAAGAASTIAKALANREHWRMAGLENAGRFSMKVMIDGYVQCYRAAMRQRSLSGQIEVVVNDSRADNVRDG